MQITQSTSPRADGTCSFGASATPAPQAGGAGLGADGMSRTVCPPPFAGGDQGGADLQNLSGMLGNFMQMFASMFASLFGELGSLLGSAGGTSAAPGMPGAGGAPPFMPMNGMNGGAAQRSPADQMVTSGGPAQP